MKIGESSSAQKKSAKGKEPRRNNSNFSTIDKELAFNLDVPNGKAIASARANRNAKGMAGSSTASHEVLAWVRDNCEADELSDLQISAALKNVAEMLQSDVSSLTVDDLTGWEDEIDKALPEARAELTGREESAAKANTGKAKPPWKTPRTTQDQKDIRADLPNDTPGHHLMSEKSTLHHKISRSHLKGMLTALNAAPSDEKGVNEMHQFVQRVTQITHTGAKEKAIENWAANIELGFYSHEREDDPGSAFDGSYDDTGTATPRTALLEEADAILLSPKINWADLVTKLTAVQAKQEELELDPGVGRGKEKLTFPRKNIWEKEGDTYKRRGKGEKK